MNRLLLVQLGYWKMWNGEKRIAQIIPVPFMNKLQGTTALQKQR